MTQTSQQKSLVCLGMITGAHGIRGSVRLKTFTEHPENLTRYGALQDDSGCFYTLKIQDIRPNGHLIASIEGVHDRNQAEALQGVRLCIERHSLPQPKDDEFYYTDLIGLRVLNLEDHCIGSVKAVHNFGAGDLLEITLEMNPEDFDRKNFSKKTQMTPFSRDAVPHVDIREGYVKIDPSFLMDDKTP